MNQLEVAMAILGFCGLFLFTLAYIVFRESKEWRLHYAWFRRPVGNKRYRGYLMRRPKPVWGWEYRLPEPHEDPEFKGYMVAGFIKAEESAP